VFLAILGVALYLGIRHLPSLDKVKAMMNRMWGVKAAAAKDMIAQSSAAPAAKTVDKLTKTAGGGGVGFPFKWEDWFSASPMPKVEDAKDPAEFFMNTIKDTVSGVNAIKGGK
jgi:hypothetical protein